METIPSCDSAQSTEAVAIWWLKHVSFQVEVFRKGGCEAPSKTSGWPQANVDADNERCWSDVAVQLNFRHVTHVLAKSCFKGSEFVVNPVVKVDKDTDVSQGKPTSYIYPCCSYSPVFQIRFYGIIEAFCQECMPDNKQIDAPIRQRYFHSGDWQVVPERSQAHPGCPWYCSDHVADGVGEEHRRTVRVAHRTRGM